jgi:hypothetical protein
MLCLQELAKESIYTFTHFLKSTLILLFYLRPVLLHRLMFFERDNCLVIQGYSKRSIHFQKFILRKLLALNLCPVHGWKGNLSKFWYRWSEVAHHWGCGCCCLWHAATSVGRAGLSIWHLTRQKWGSHRVLIRCENNFESSPFSLYVAHRHMFNSTCEIIFWKCILLFE